MGSLSKSLIGIIPLIMGIFLSQISDLTGPKILAGGLILAGIIILLFLFNEDKVDQFIKSL